MSGRLKESEGQCCDRRPPGLILGSTLHQAVVHNAFGDCFYPCKTNAHCGPGGVYAPGISCCGKPSKKGDLFATKNTCGEARGIKQ